MRPPRGMWRTAHQVTLAAPVRLTARVSAQACCHSSYVVCADAVRVIDTRVVHQYVDAAERPGDALDHRLDRHPDRPDRRGPARAPSPGRSARTASAASREEP